MAKSHSRFVCQSCGDAFLRWEGQCRTCEAWNTLVETVVREPARAGRSPTAAVLAGRGAPEPLRSIAEAIVAARIFEVEGVRIPTASIEHLIASKRTGRAQDAADIEVLEEIRRLRGGAPGR